MTQAQSDLMLPDLVRAQARHRGSDRAFAYLDLGQISRTLTFAELAKEMDRVAVGVRARTQPGDRVLLAFAPGLDFVTAFLGCLAANRIAVPLPLPKGAAAQDRFDAIARDCAPVLGLSDVASLAHLPGAAGFWLPLDALDDLTDGVAAGGHVQPGTNPADLALLQYTSGSTSDPKGVCITHGNMRAIQATIDRAAACGPEDRCLSWLPVEHDMGLFGGALHMLWHGATAYLMSPDAFVRHPWRWLSAMSEHEITVTVAPNSAYDLALRLTSQARARDLRLDRLRLMFCGAEPIDAQMIAAFSERFAGHGLRAEAFLPCYGMAEATLLVSGLDHADPPLVLRARRADLDRGRFVACDAGAPGADVRALVSCGAARTTHGVKIVNPESGHPVPDDTIGEIWIAGDTVAAGYWANPQASSETFGARLPDGSGPFLRSGDLGMIHDGALFVTGRLKDLVIIQGRTLHPGDLERDAHVDDPALRRGRVVVVQTDPPEQEVIVIHEARTSGSDPADLAARLWRAVLMRQGVVVDRILFVPPGTLLRTTSGKLRRRATLGAVLDGAVAPVVDWRPPRQEEGRNQAVQTLAARRGGLQSADLDRFVTSWLAAMLGDDDIIEDLGDGAAWADLGLSSLHATAFVADLEAATGMEQPLDLMFRFQDGPALLAHLEDTLCR